MPSNVSNGSFRRTGDGTILPASSGLQNFDDTPPGAGAAEIHSGSPTAGSATDSSSGAAGGIGPANSRVPQSFRLGRLGVGIRRTCRSTGRRFLRRLCPGLSSRFRHGAVGVLCGAVGRTRPGGSSTEGNSGTALAGHRSGRVHPEARGGARTQVNARPEIGLSHRGKSPRNRHRPKPGVGDAGTIPQRLKDRSPRRRMFLVRRIRYNDEALRGRSVWPQVIASSKDGLERRNCAAIERENFDFKLRPDVESCAVGRLHPGRFNG